MEKFKAYKLTETPEKKIRAEFVDMSLDELDPGAVVVRVAYSDVNYKDALAATGKGRILRRASCIGGIDFSGTAGFTAGLGIVRMEQNGLKPANGPVIVSGATGGVGSIAVSSLSRLGY